MCETTSMRERMITPGDFIAMKRGNTYDLAVVTNVSVNFRGDRTATIRWASDGGNHMIHDKSEYTLICVGVAAADVLADLKRLGA